MSSPQYPFSGFGYVAQSRNHSAEAGNIIAQGLQALVQGKERDSGIRAMAGQFESLGPEGQQMAEVMRSDPGAAARVFEMYGGADKLHAYMHNKYASQNLAQSMSQLRGSRGEPGAEVNTFDYPGFMQRGLELGIPTGQLSAAVQAIANGENVNLPDVGTTEDWMEQNGQSMRRRLFYDKNTGQIVAAGDWAPAFRPPTSRMTRINPETGELEIYENMTPLQQSKEQDRAIGASKQSENAATLLGILESSPGVSGMRGSVGGVAGGIASQGAGLINSLMGEEVFDADATEDEVSSAIMGADPRVRARYFTVARNFETQVRNTMDLGKPSDKDLELVQETAAALDAWKSPRAIQEAVENLTYLGEKYQYIHDIEIGKTPRVDWSDRNAAIQWIAQMEQAGVSRERATRMAFKIYKSIGEVAQPNAQ